MFEYINRKREPIEVIFYCAGVPFGLFWAFWRTPIAGFALQVYLTTAIVFLFYPFDMQKQHVKQRWFWNRLFTVGAIIHPLFLASLWYLDMTYPIFVAGTGTVGLVGFLAGVVEMVVVGETVDYLGRDRKDL